MKQSQSMKLLPKGERLLRLPAVMEIVGLSRPQIYSAMAEGKFPRQIKITEKAVAWTASSIDSWMQERINAAA
jgi:prophage regulatory protein